MYSTTIILQVLQTEHPLSLAVGVWSIQLVLMQSLDLYAACAKKELAAMELSSLQLGESVRSTQLPGNHELVLESLIILAREQCMPCCSMICIGLLYANFTFIFTFFRESLWSTIKDEAPSYRLPCSPLSYTSKYSFFILIVLHWCSHLFVISYHPVKIPLNLIYMFSRNFL